METGNDQLSPTQAEIRSLKARLAALEEAAARVTGCLRRADKLDGLDSGWQIAPVPELVHSILALRAALSASPAPRDSSPVWSGTICKETGRWEEQGRCPVHGGDACLVCFPAILREHGEMLREKILRRDDLREAREIIESLLWLVTGHLGNLTHSAQTEARAWLEARPAPGGGA